MQIILVSAYEDNIFNKPILFEMRFLIQENNPEKKYQINLVYKLYSQIHSLENATNTLVSSQPMVTILFKFSYQEPTIKKFTVLANQQGFF